MTKASLRKIIQKQIASMSTEQKKESSEGVCKNLRSISSIVNSNSILTFLPLHDEVNLKPVISGWINESKTISIPIVCWEDKTMRCGLITSLDDDNLVETRHGIVEPLAKHTVSNDCIETILVPGVGFDSSGGRLGRGGGFYDRFLSVSRPPVVIGVCFDEQIVDKVPREMHDQLMTAIVTPTNVLIG